MTFSPSFYPLLILTRRRIVFFFLPQGALRVFLRMIQYFLTLGTEPSVCTQYWGIFSADTNQTGMHTLYLHSQRNWQMVGDKRSIPWSCRRTISTDPRFQSLKDTMQQPNRMNAQHSARSKAGAWNVCQDSLIQTCSVSKMEINLANLECFYKEM